MAKQKKTPTENIDAINGSGRSERPDPANHNEFIEVFGAREHNLKNIDISIPKNKLVVFTGVSGSGKSSLAFDTIYNEGQRRYMESFSAYARQFVGDMERPDVDKITGLSPVISIEQKTTNKNPRSTVGTVTEIYDFLRLLYARVGEAYSYNTGKKMVKFSEEEIVLNIFEKFSGKKITVLAPLVRSRKGHYRELFEDIRKKGFVKVRIDGEIKDLAPKMQVDRYKIHDIEAVVDRLAVTDDMQFRLSQSVQKSLQMGKGLMFVEVMETTPPPPPNPSTPLRMRGTLKDAKNAKSVSKSKIGSTTKSEELFESAETEAPLQGTGGAVVMFSKQLMCLDTGISYEEPSPNAFSFNSPYGACPTCKGLGSVYTIDMESVVPDGKKSVKEGGIAPLGEERDASVFQQVSAFARKYKINLDRPVKDMPQEQMDLLLFGDKGISPTLEMDLSDDTVPNEFTGSYEGIIPMLKRWFSSTNSTDVLREWVEKFTQLKTCGTCGGARLRKESLWFKIDERNIAELGEMNLDNLEE